MALVVSSAVGGAPAPSLRSAQSGEVAIARLSRRSPAPRRESGRRGITALHIAVDGFGVRRSESPLWDGMECRGVYKVTGMWLIGLFFFGGQHAQNATGNTRGTKNFWWAKEGCRHSI